jgi:hypothetical protein
MLAAVLSVANLFLYCVQQIGVTLGVGAESVLLVAYLYSTRDGVIDDKEQHFVRIARKVMDIGLFFMIVSGMAILGTAYLVGQSVFSPVFGFKWSLIGIVLSMSILNRGTSLAAGLVQGFSAATWYAIFLVHILAPDLSWATMGTFYGMWLVGFMVVWTGLVFAVRGNPRGVPKPTKAAPHSPAVQIIPKQNSRREPAQPQMSRMPQQNFAAVRENRSESFAQASSEVVSASIPAPTPSPARPVRASAGLPPPPAPRAMSTAQELLGTLHVMPRTPEDLAKVKTSIA